MEIKHTHTEVVHFFVILFCQFDRRKSDRKVKVKMKIKYTHSEYQSIRSVKAHVKSTPHTHTCSNFNAPNLDGYIYSKLARWFQNLQKFKSNIRAFQWTECFFKQKKNSESELTMQPTNIVFLLCHIIFGLIDTMWDRYRGRMKESRHTIYRVNCHVKSFYCGSRFFNIDKSAEHIKCLQVKYIYHSTVELFSLTESTSAGLSAGTIIFFVYKISNCNQI